MANKPIMRTLARWHIWLGWLVGVPVLMWTATGLFMVSRPIEEVRGNHLRLPADQAALVIEGSDLATPDAQLSEITMRMQGGRAVAVLTTLDGVTSRVDVATGAPLPPLDAADARTIAAERIAGGEQIRSITLFAADAVPFDFRRPMPVWQVALANGTHVYIGRDTGEIEAVRTRWWRWFDFAWGLHIMDLSDREDTSHPILILFAALSLTGAVFGCVLMFRRRKARPKAIGETGTP
jgi:hypothetical protein